ncbi:hypothetical protein M2L40_000702 [Staphylococcus pseudintermedius]|nr:hypothetical protein [Staphylococcus pseudintermedius]
MNLITIDYKELRRLIQQEALLKEDVAKLEDELEELKIENHYLKLERGVFDNE